MSHHQARIVMCAYVTALTLSVGCDPATLGLFFCELQGCVLSQDRTPDPDNIIVGAWREQAAIGCPGDETTQRVVISEILFNTDGSFAVTWFPFEAYVDYAGTYTFDPGSGALAMTVEWGNYIPEGLDLVGSVEIDAEDTLRLVDIFLGVESGSNDGPVCGHILSDQ